MREAEGREGASSWEPGCQPGPSPVVCCPLRPPRPCSQRSLSVQILQNHTQFRMFKTYDKEMEFFFSSVMCTHLIPGTDLSQRMEDGNSEGRAWFVE